MHTRAISRFALLAAGVWAIQQMIQARHARRTIPVRKPEAIQAWEGEGGAVPVGGNRTAAAVTPAADLPESKSEFR